MSSFKKRSARLLGAAVALLALATPASLEAKPDSLKERETRLKHGEVVVGLHNQGEIKYVTGTIMINQSPDKVWPIMANPYEFQGKISPRMKDLEIMVDKSDVSVMKVTMDVPVFIPKITYIVESKYANSERIDFKRVGGTLKDFKGFWSTAPKDGGTKTELTYSMYLDPGFYVPQWIVREGVKNELPRTLELLRERVKAVYEEAQPPVTKNIVAANPIHPYIAAGQHGVVY